MERGKDGKENGQVVNGAVRWPRTPFTRPSILYPPNTYLFMWAKVWGYCEGRRGVSIIELKELWESSSLK